jgi:mono/diheme cytochrome c family protein
LKLIRKWGVISGEHFNKSMKAAKLNLAFILTAALGMAAAGADDATGGLPPAATKTGVTFDADIKPIFQEHCFKCHNGAGPKKPKARLALNTREGVLKGSKDGPVIKVGDSAHSDLVLAVAHVGDDPDTYMPKGQDAKRLTPEQIGLIRAWIDEGAK